MTNLDSIKQKHYFANKGLSSQGYGFSSSHVWIWELDCEESWEPKNWCFWTVVLEKTLESPMNCKEIQPVHSKGDQSWVFFGRNEAGAEPPVLWPPHAKSWLIGKDWCWDGLGAGGKGDGRGWDGWMTSPTWWTWVWVNSGSWWWTGRPGMLWFMGSQRVGHDWATELNWTETLPKYILLFPVSIPLLQLILLFGMFPICFIPRHIQLSKEYLSSKVSNYTPSMKPFIKT